MAVHFVLFRSLKKRGLVCNHYSRRSSTHVFQTHTKTGLKTKNDHNLIVHLLRTQNNDHLNFTFEQSMKNSVKMIYN